MDDTGIELWDTQTGRLVRVLEKPRLGDIGWTTYVAFSRDGRLVLTGSGFMHARGEPPEDGNAVYVWDAKSGCQLLSFRSAGWPLQTVSLANDSTRIFADSADGMGRRYECEVCLPLPVLSDLISSRTGRSLSGVERARYVPESALLGWLAGRFR
jgi:WD40 repeat protein